MFGLVLTCDTVSTIFFSNSICYLSWINYGIVSASSEHACKSAKMILNNIILQFPVSFYVEMDGMTNEEKKKDILPWFLHRIPFVKSFLCFGILLIPVIIQN